MRLSCYLRWIVGVGCLVGAAGLMSFEIWLEPSAFHFSNGQSCDIRLLKGESFIGNSWGAAASVIAKFDFHTFTGTQPLRGNYSPGEKKDLTVRFTQEGTHVVSLETVNRREAMDTDAFNEALDNSGLEKISWPSDSVPVYVTRSSKLLLQVGKGSGSLFRESSGFALEVIPVNNPYLLARGDQMQFRLVFDGKPLGYAKLRVWNRKGVRVLIQNIYTEKDGTMMTPLSNDGIWMVTADKMVKTTLPGAGWQRYETSLVFGFE